MKKCFVILMSLIIVVNMLIGSSPIAAQEDTSFLGKVEDQLKDSIRVTNKNTVQDYTSHSMSEVGNDIQIQTKKNNLNPEKSTLVKYVDPDTQEVLFINNIPISLENSHELTNISVIYDEKGKIIQYTEMYLTKNSQGNFKFTSFVDNQKIIEKNTNEKFMTAKEYAEQLEGPQLKFSTSKLAKCLGISMGLADVIGIGCTAACFATAGTGCLVCVAGLAGFAVGGNSVCIANAFS